MSSEGYGKTMRRRVQALADQIFSKYQTDHALAHFFAKQSFAYEMLCNKHLLEAYNEPAYEV